MFRLYSRQSWWWCSGANIGYVLASPEWRIVYGWRRVLYLKGICTDVLRGIEIHRYKQEIFSRSFSDC